jgi:hypothetical protein
MENELTLSQDQIDALVKVCQRVIEAVRELWERIKSFIIECVKDLYEKFVKPFIRHLFLLQLLEWKVPFWLARILQKITPFIWAQGIGLRFWRGLVRNG